MIALLLLAGAVAAPPNVVVVLADDLAMGDLGCYGQKLIRTPHLDRMAADGTRFTQAYCGTAVCAPSRASLLLGRHTGHSPVRGNREVQPEGQRPLPARTPTLAHLFKQAGYATGCVGKWGMGMFDTPGSPLKVGFDHFFGYNCQRHAHSYYPAYLYRGAERFELPGNDGKGVGKTYAQNLIADEVDRWLGSVAGRPFFLFYPVTLPHGRYEIDSLGEYAGRDWTEQEKTYAAMVSRLDADVGRLLAALDRLGRARDTMVLVVGDNGSAFAPDSPVGKRFDQSMGGTLRGFKRSLYEGGLRQAAVLCGPGVPAGRVCDVPWAFWDILPTCADYLGVKSSPTDGVSVRPLWAGGPAPTRDVFYWELHEGKGFKQAVRFGDWKAVRNAPGASVELYDLAADPAEARNLAGERPEVLKRAAALLASERSDHPDWPVPTSR